MMNAQEARDMIRDIENEDVQIMLNYIESTIVDRCKEKRYSTPAIDWSHLTFASQQDISRILTGYGYRVEFTAEKS